MADKLMYILNDDKIIPFVDYNQQLKRLDTQLIESNNQIHKPKNKKTLS